MTLTREPSASARRRSARLSSTRRPTWLTMRWQMFISWPLSRKRMPVLDLAVDFDEHRVGAPLTMTSAMSSRASSGSERP